MTEKTRELVAYSTRRMYRDLLDELRLMRIRQRRSMEDIFNEALEIGVRILIKRELKNRERRKEGSNG